MEVTPSDDGEPSLDDDGGAPKKVVIGFCHSGVSRGWYELPPPEGLPIKQENIMSERTVIQIINKYIFYKHNLPLLSLLSELRVGVLTTAFLGALAPEAATEPLSNFIEQKIKNIKINKKAILF